MNELIADWMGYASIPMYDDGVITWWANKKSDYFPTLVDELEKDLGINFERVESAKDAEIRSKRVKSIASTSGAVLGNARWSPENRVWKLKTRIGDQYDSTVIHELGHALGLGHPVDHAATTNTAMSYNRDRSIKRFFYKDLDIFNTIYIEREYVLGDVKPEKINIDMVIGDCAHASKKKASKSSNHTYDQLTGVHHMDYI